MTLIGNKEAQSGRMCYGEVLHFWLQRSTIWKNVLQLAQSNRMSIVGEGIECLVTKTLHTLQKPLVGTGFPHPHLIPNQRDPCPTTVRRDRVSLSVHPQPRPFTPSPSVSLRCPNHDFQERQERQDKNGRVIV